MRIESTPDSNLPKPSERSGLPGEQKTTGTSLSKLSDASSPQQGLNTEFTGPGLHGIVVRTASQSNEHSTEPARGEVVVTTNSIGSAGDSPRDVVQENQRETSSVEEPPRAAGGGGSDLPPPDNTPEEFEDFPDGQTVLDMPRAERKEVLNELKQFTEGGKRYERNFILHDEKGSRPESERGYIRNVPPEALAAEGLNYAVEVKTYEGKFKNPYVVSMTATRTVPCELDLPTGENGALEPQHVDGREEKGVDFVGMFGKVITMDSQSTLTAPASGSVEITPGEPFQFGYMADDSAPLLTLNEMRKIMRAVSRADEYPDETGRTALLVTRALFGRADFSDVEIPANGETFTDLSQPVRGALMTEIDTFARSGELTKDEETGRDRYALAIPDDILRAHGFEGSAEAVVVEDPDFGFYRASISTVRFMERDLSEYLRSENVRVIRDAELSLFAVTGPQTGVEKPEGSFDKTAGENDIHMDYDGSDFIQNDKVSVMAERLSYQQAISLLLALREVNQRGNK